MSRGISEYEMFFPSLSEDGWVTESQLILDYLISHFFLSDYSQTQIYLGNISSLPYIIQENTNDINGTIRGIEEQLKKYLSRHYSNVFIEVNEPSRSLDTSKAELNLFVKVVDEQNKEFNLSKILQIQNSKISKIISVNNFGE